MFSCVNHTTGRRYCTIRAWIAMSCAAEHSTGSSRQYASSRRPIHTPSCFSKRRRCFSIKWCSFSFDVSARMRSSSTRTARFCSIVRFSPGPLYGASWAGSCLALGPTKRTGFVPGGSAETDLLTSSVALRQPDHFAPKVYAHYFQFAWSSLGVYIGVWIGFCLPCSPGRAATAARRASADFALTRGRGTCTGTGSGCGRTGGT